MRTKLQAADIAAAQGINVLVMNGKNLEALYDIMEGKKELAKKIQSTSAI